MKITFDYNQQRDVRCLIDYGKSSTNSSTPTKMYQRLVDDYGENPTESEVVSFIEKYIAEKNIYIQKQITTYQEEWDAIAYEYTKRAEAIFEVSLPSDVTAYLTINNRCPYSIESNFFLISFPMRSAKKTVMHELWHFYTWYKFGITWEEKLGKQKYNDLKESLTILLDHECNDLFSDGEKDSGYVQHAQLRSDVVKIWQEEKNIDKLWGALVSTHTESSGF